MSDELIPEGYEDTTSSKEKFDHRVQMLANAWESTGLCKVREVKIEGSSAVHLRCRVRHSDEERLVKGPGRDIMKEFRGTVHLFFGRQYTLKDDDDDSLIQAFVISAGGDNLYEAMLEMGTILQRYTPRREVMSAPLLGPSTPEGSVVTGPGRGKAGARAIKA